MKELLKKQIILKYKTLQGFLYETQQTDTIIDDRELVL